MRAPATIAACLGLLACVAWTVMLTIGRAKKRRNPMFWNDNGVLMFSAFAATMVIGLVGAVVYAGVVYGW